MPTWRCSHPGCDKHSSYGVKGSKEREFCGRHAKDGMVDVRSKRCGHPGCEKHPSFGAEGSKKAEFCARHAHDGMVNVSNKRCNQPGCSTRASFGVEGTKRAEFCAQHALEGMVDVWSKRNRCRHSGCMTRACFALHGKRRGEFCARHATEGMTNVNTRKRIGSRGYVCVVDGEGLESDVRGGEMYKQDGDDQLKDSSNVRSASGIETMSTNSSVEAGELGGDVSSATSAGGAKRSRTNTITTLLPEESAEETAAIARLFLGLRTKRAWLEDEDCGANVVPHPR